MRSSATRSAMPTATYRSTSATRPPSCPNRRSSTPPSPGATTAVRTFPGSGRSSTRPTSRVSRSATRACRTATAASSPASRTMTSCSTSRAWRHLRRAPADPRLRGRQLPRREGPAELLGLQHAGLLRARPALHGDALRQRVQGTRLDLPPQRPRGHPRRGLQPHGGRQRERSDALLQGHRQRDLLSAPAGQQALLHQRHRHG